MKWPTKRMALRTASHFDLQRHRRHSFHFLWLVAPSPTPLRSREYHNFARNIPNLFVEGRSRSNRRQWKCTFPLNCRTFRNRKPWNKRSLATRFLARTNPPMDCGGTSQKETLPSVGVAGAWQCRGQTSGLSRGGPAWQAPATMSAGRT